MVPFLEFPRMRALSPDVAAVGAGFGEPSALHRVRGLGLSFRVYEAGGTGFCHCSRGLARIEATRESENAWVEHVKERAERTIYTTCDSWEPDANVPGKPRVFTPSLGFPRYAAKSREVAERGYPGLQLSL